MFDIRYRIWWLRSIKFIFTIRIRNPKNSLNSLQMKFSRKIFLRLRGEKSLFAIEISFETKEKILFSIQRQFTAKARKVYDGERSVLFQHTKLGFMGHDYLFLIFYGAPSGYGDKRSLAFRNIFPLWFTAELLTKANLGDAATAYSPGRWSRFSFKIQSKCNFFGNWNFIAAEESKGEAQMAQTA